VPDDAPAPSKAEAPDSTRPEEEPEAPAKPSNAEPPSWKTLLDRRDYRRLLTELGPDQVEQAIWQSDAAQLIDLGAAARELGDARAGWIYSVVRSRFPGTEAAADAAFLLGRMKFHSGVYRSSSTWFETYLRERPDGRLAREAAGRLVEAYHQSGDADRAREAAEQYLDRYPNGPHAGLARSVLQ
jgi:TolA-binding protein